jgi:hypothetical protein
MDPNELLATVRADFMRMFMEAAQQSISNGIEQLYKKADLSHSSVEQGWMMTARSVLGVKREALLQQMHREMEHLLNRSFQTTYNSFRPSVNVSSDNLSLVESSALEDELRINQMTQNFRNEAEGQLRDLNIRIALLFEQDAINERENPFRPYLFCRCITRSVDALEQSEFISLTLVTQLCESLALHVGAIYDHANDIFAKHGIAAQLQMKIKHAPESRVPAAERTVPAGYMPGYGPMGGFDAPAGGQMQAGGPAHNTGTREFPSDLPRGRIEQWMDAVRMLAMGVAGVGGMGPRGAVDGEAGLAAMAAGQAGAAAGGQVRGLPRAGAYPGMAQPGAEGWALGMPGSDLQPAAPARHSWLTDTQGVGEVLRRFFSEGASWQSKVAGQRGVAAQAAAAGQAGMGGAAGGMPGQAEGMPGAAYGPGGGGDFNVPHAAYAETPLSQSVYGMLREQTPPGAQMLDQQGQVRNLIMEQREQLSEQARGVDEQMTIDVVAMLFEFILRDQQVPAEIRAQLGRLQFLVLKLALRDPALLVQKGHPVRLLINRIGSVSLGLSQVDPSAIKVTEEICRIVAVLLEDQSEDPASFAKALDELDAFITGELRTGNDHVDRAVKAVEKAQSRTLRFAHTTAQMAQALADLTIDPFLRRFLENDWVHAIEHAGRDDATKEKRYRLMVPDLLWSIIPKTKDEERAQFRALLPIILNTLREGLSLIGWDKEKQQGVLNWLMDAHTSAMRAGQIASSGSLQLPVIHRHFNRFVDNPEQEMSAEEVAAGAHLPKQKQFLDQAIEELDVKVQWLDSVFATDQELHKGHDPLLADTVTRIAEEEANQTVLQRLQHGVALEINLGGQFSPAKLNWVNPDNSNLMLTLTGQAAPTMVSLQMFRRLLEHGRVRFQEDEPLFERAVEALLESADHIGVALH